jgi:putative polyhydroxyalkanoate system protein
MAEISITRAHTLEKQEVRRRIEELAIKINDRIGGSWDWQGDDAVSEARGAKARVGYDERSISIEISLPMAMRPFRRRLEAKIDEYLERLLE